MKTEKYNKNYLFEMVNKLDPSFKINIKENITSPTFERLVNLDGLKNFSNNKFKIVKFAYDDEGNNFFALLDLINKKIISYSLSGSSEIKKYNDLNININEAKKEEKWMQKALGKTKEKPEGKHPGALHKDLGIPEDQKIPMSLINKKIKELEKASEGDKKLSKKELKLLHRLIAAKNMKEVNESLENENINDFINETITNIDDIILD